MRDSNPTASESIESKLACSADLSHTDVLGNEKHDKGGPAYCCISPDTQICMLVLSEQDKFPEHVLTGRI